jgi:hypothetical protein
MRRKIVCSYGIRVQKAIGFLQIPEQKEPMGQSLGNRR